MRRVIFVSGVLFLILLLSGCVSWDLTTGHYESRWMGVSFDTPLEWYELAGKEYYVLTRNGVELDRVKVVEYLWSDTVPGTTVELDKGYLLHEYLNMFVNAYRNTGDASRIDVYNKKVIELDSVSAGMSEFVYSGMDGIEYQGFMICCPRDNSLLMISYEAPSEYYYDVCKDAVYDLVASLGFQ